MCFQSIFFYSNIYAQNKTVSPCVSVGVDPVATCMQLRVHVGLKAVLVREGGLCLSTFSLVKAFDVRECDFVRVIQPINDSDITFEENL